MYFLVHLVFPAKTLLGPATSTVSLDSTMSPADSTGDSTTPFHAAEQQSTSALPGMIGAPLGVLTLLLILGVMFTVYQRKRRDNVPPKSSWSQHWEKDSRSLRNNQRNLSKRSTSFSLTKDKVLSKLVSLFFANGSYLRHHVRIL